MKIISRSCRCIKQKTVKWQNTKPWIKKTSNIEYIISISILLYVDNFAVPFENRNDVIKGLKTIENIMLKFGLTIHKVAGRKKSKTEAVFFPCNNIIKLDKKRATNIQLSKLKYQPSQELSPKKLLILSPKKINMTCIKMQKKQNFL